MTERQAIRCAFGALFGVLAFVFAMGVAAAWVMGL